MPSLRENKKTSRKDAKKTQRRKDTPLPENLFAPSPLREIKKASQKEKLQLIYKSIL